MNDKADKIAVQCTQALDRGETALNEFEAKKVLDAYAIPVTRERLVTSMEEATAFAEEIGYPVVLKGSSTTLTHKTELNLVELGIENAGELEVAYKAIMARGQDQLDGILVQEMIKGSRELVVGLIRDPQFGPCVMFGLGGIFTEALKDVTFRVAPIETRDALEMMDEIRAKKLLEPFRGSPAVNREVLARILVNLGQIGLEVPEIREIDINPLIVRGDTPVAVDSLIVLGRP